MFSPTACIIGPHLQSERFAGPGLCAQLIIRVFDDLTPEVHLELFAIWGEIEKLDLNFGLMQSLCPAPYLPSARSRSLNAMGWEAMAKVDGDYSPQRVSKQHKEVAVVD